MFRSVVTYRVYAQATFYNETVIMAYIPFPQQVLSFSDFFFDGNSANGINFLGIQIRFFP
jgi:hypothetical protein